jgi:putative flippase GtrA
LLQLARFATVGATSVVVYAATVSFCIRLLGFDVAAATIPGYLAAMVLNYALQKLWTFPSDARHVTAAPRYLFVHAIGVALNYGAVQVLMGRAHTPYLLAQAIAIAMIAAWSYLAQKHWAFAGRKRAA